MTNEQWEHFEKELSGMFGTVKMLIDGYRVHFGIRCYSIKGMTRRDCIMVYIENSEGKAQWEWKWSQEEGPIRDKFCNKKESFLHKKKYRDEMEKAMKRAKRSGWKDMVTRIYNQKICFYSPAWFSAKRLKAHLLKNCTSIELIVKDNNESN